MRYKHLKSKSSNIIISEKSEKQINQRRKQKGNTAELSREKAKEQNHKNDKKQRKQAAEVRSKPTKISEAYAKDYISRSCVVSYRN